MKKKADLEELVEISRYYGADPDFVRAGGGNTSLKTDDHIYIKSSGVSLAHIQPSDFVQLDRKGLQRIWENRGKDIVSDMMSAKTKKESDKRPSVETLLHDLLPQRYVVHTHPALVNGLTCGKNGKSKASELFSEEALWIPTVNPGFTLASTIKSAIKKHGEKYRRHPQILLFQNHGLVVAADSLEEMKTVTDKVISKLASEILRRPDFSPVPVDSERASLLAPAIRMLLKEEDEGSICVFQTNAEISRLVNNRRAFSPVCSAFSPDHIVYCGQAPLFVSACRDIDHQYKALETALKDYRKRNGVSPQIVAIEKLGIFAWGLSKKSADITLSVFKDAVKVSIYSEAFGGPRFMPPDQIDFIVKWEIEAYRKSVSAGEAGKTKALRLFEKIAMVTGSAQGFGEGCAEAMLKEGCNVALADLNAGLARRKAEKLCAIYGKGKAHPVKVDVSEEKAVKQSIINTVLEYGGLDILVSNAGILIAGSLEDMDQDQFDFVTKVNYRGYYLCTKYASKIMKIQHRFAKNYTMDIIQINSKSGLAGSSKNFAYAGSKFGGIGLTQSFALELVEYNIKVNAICPGNFFDGPLWSDPDKGLFVQYLKANKIPGAETIEDVRSYYESRVPMKRGVKIEDIARALIYLIEQTYETGQALTVTGGQIMLN